jgi:hypothetical protein
LARTHSRLSFDELCEEAFGEIGLHPWEFYEYQLYEYVLKRKGYVKGQVREQNLNLQNMLLASMAPHMKKEDRAKVVRQVFKDDNNKGGSLKERYEAMMKKHAELIPGELKVSNVKRDKNSNRG